MADGYRKKRVAWEEKRKRSGKRKEKKRDGLSRKRQDTDMGPTI